MIPPTPEASGETLSDAQIQRLIAEHKALRGVVAEIVARFDGPLPGSFQFGPKGRDRELPARLRALLDAVDDVSTFEDAAIGGTTRQSASLPAAQGGDVAALIAQAKTFLGQWNHLDCNVGSDYDDCRRTIVDLCALFGIAQPPVHADNKLKLSPHGPVDEQTMKHFYGASGYVKPAALDARLSPPQAGETQQTDEPEPYPYSLDRSCSLATIDRLTGSREVPAQGAPEASVEARTACAQINGYLHAPEADANCHVCRVILAALQRAREVEK